MLCYAAWSVVAFVAAHVILCHWIHVATPAGRGRPGGVKRALLVPRQMSGDNVARRLPCYVLSSFACWLRTIDSCPPALDTFLSLPPSTISLSVARSALARSHSHARRQSLAAHLFDFQPSSSSMAGIVTMETTDRDCRRRRRPRGRWLIARPIISKPR